MSKSYFKLFPKDLIVDGYQYILGNNKTDFLKPHYFYDLKNIIHLNISKDIIGIIEIPSEFAITEIYDGYKSPEINIIELYTYQEFLEREDLYLEEKKKILDPIFIVGKMPYLQTFEICKRAVEYHGYSLKYIKPEFRTHEIYSISVRNHINNLILVPYEYQTPEMLLNIFNTKYRYFKYLNPELQTEKICKAAIRKFCYNIQYLHPNFQTDENYSIGINNPNFCLKFLIPELQTLKMCKVAVEKNSDNLQYVREDYKGYFQ